MRVSYIRPDQQTLMRAYNAGYDAYSRGGKNPFSALHCPNLYMAWMSGFAEANIEYEQITLGAVPGGVA